MSRSCACVIPHAELFNVEPRIISARTNLCMCGLPLDSAIHCSESLKGASERLPDNEPEIKNKSSRAIYCDESCAQASRGTHIAEQVTARHKVLLSPVICRINIVNASSNWDKG
jgi:hypothetical protein